MISLKRDQKRFNHSSSALAEAGVHPLFFPGVDGTDDTISQDILDRACTRQGCGKRVFQALVESHRQALVEAQKRDKDWTAIFEDDVIPDLGAVNGEGGKERWMEEFEDIWAKLPPNARFVRLGRCMMKTWPGEGSPSQVGMKMVSVAEAGRFRITQWTGIKDYVAYGGCTHAYVVHKEIIPELLSLLPCPCALDCCLEWNYFHKQGETKELGLEILYNIDTQMTPDESAAEAAKTTGLLKNVYQFGVFKQDWGAFPDGISATGLSSQSLLSLN
jgi:hypothetical protein